MSKRTTARTRKPNKKYSSEEWESAGEKLTTLEIQKIIKFCKKVISKAIIFGGSSIKNFSSSSGKKGSFQQYFTVYGKKEENCPKVNCTGKIKKIVITNRSSFFCNKCQK